MNITSDAYPERQRNGLLAAIARHNGKLIAGIIHCSFGIVAFISRDSVRLYIPIGNTQ